MARKDSPPFKMEGLADSYWDLIGHTMNVMIDAHTASEYQPLVDRALDRAEAALHTYADLLCKSWYQ